MQALTDLARVLVWPLALVVLAIVFRRPLSRLLVTVTRLRFRDLEIDFGRELERLRASLPSNPPVEGGAEAGAAQAAAHPTLGLAAEAVSAQPLAGVLLAWTALESQLSARAGADRPAGGSLPGTLGLPAELRSLVEGLRRLSSAAAGGRVKGGAVGPDQARRYVDLVGQALGWLGSTA